ILQGVVREQVAAHAEETPASAFALALLAWTELHLEATHAAREHGDKAREIYRKIFGDRHLQIARTVAWTAGPLVEDGDAKLAIERYREAQRIYEANGVLDDWYISLEHEMGVAYDEGLHDPKTAEYHFRIASEKFRKMLGDNHSATLYAD